jgi:YggT family protein
MNGLLSVGYFLFSLFFNLVIFILWARIILRYFRISALHPISQAINTLTNPVIKPIDRLLGLNKSKPGIYDRSAFSILVLVEFIKIASISLIFLGAMMPALYLLIYILADLIIQPCNLLFYAIIIRVVMSWVNPGWNHPAAEVLYLITEPLFRFGRKIIPNISGFDFAPIVVLIILKIITLFIQGTLPIQLL